MIIQQATSHSVSLGSMFISSLVSGLGGAIGFIIILAVLQIFMRWYQTQKTKSVEKK